MFGAQLRIQPKDTHIYTGWQLIIFYEPER